MDTMSDTVINFKIPKGTSYRKAKELIHIEALAIQHSIDFKVTDMQMNDKREDIDFGRFIKDCMRPSDETAAQIQELGLDIPRRIVSCKHEADKRHGHWTVQKSCAKAGG